MPELLKLTGFIPQRGGLLCLVTCPQGHLVQKLASSAPALSASVPQCPLEQAVLPTWIPITLSCQLAGPAPLSFPQTLALRDCRLSYAEAAWQRSQELLWSQNAWIRNPNLPLTGQKLSFSELQFPYQL